MSSGDDTRALLPAMADAGKRFTALVSELRPELHRHCTRMTGSVFDGEDIVQTSIEKAYYTLGQMTDPPNLRPWLFGIAHILKHDDVRAEAGFVDGVATIAVYRPATSETPTYFLVLEWTGGKITKIRDYYYVPYIAAGARFSR